MTDNQEKAQDLEDHMLLESPHFRPAFNDITNEPALPMAESPGQAAKKRKSLGRRVSFAAKAKDSDDEANDAINNREEEDPFSVKENAPAMSSQETSSQPLNSLFVGIKSPPSINRSATSTTGDANVTVTDSPRSEGTMSMASNDSIEIEVKDPQNSFNSFDSAMDDNTGRVYFGATDDMDMTGCVGGIISTAAVHSVDIQSSMNTEDNNTMDLTMAVGGILKSIPPTTSAALLDSPSSVDTMELTRTVGGILKDLHSHHGAIQSESEVTERPVIMEGLGDDMDMTVIIKDTIKTNPAPPATAPTMASPTQFLTTSKNNGNGSNNAISNKGKSPARLSGVFKSPLQSELSFIGDIDEPHNLMPNSPVPTSRKTPVKAVANEEEDLTIELFSKFIDPSKLKGLAEEAKTPTVVVAPPHPLTPKGAVLPDQLPPSQTESPTVTILLPRASLKDFLNETGVRFLDNLSSLARRETLGRPRESELVTPGKQLFVDCGLSIEGDALDMACTKLSTMISDLRDQLGKKEEKFNHSPPMPYLEYQRGAESSERSQVISRLKTLKSIVRLYTKQAWYEWRNQVHRDLNHKLQSNLSVVSRRLLALGQMTSQLDEIISQLEPMSLRLEDDLEKIRERSRIFKSGDYEQALQLEQLLHHQQSKIGTIDDEMSSLVKREQELRAAVDAAMQKRQQLQQRANMLKQELDSVPDCSPAVLEELKSTFSLQQATVGWKVIKLEDGMAKLCYSRANLMVFFKMGEDNKVSSITFDSSMVRSRVLKHVTKLFKTLPEMTLKAAVSWLGSRLDALHHLDKQLSQVDVKCTVSVPETLNIGTEVIPIALGFFHPASKTKFDILLSADANQVTYSQFLPFCGSIQESHLLDVVNLALQQKHHPIKSLVSSVLDVMDNKLS